MEHPDSSQVSHASAERLVHELESMRNAVVRLSLALEDYCFYVKSEQSPDMAREVEAILARVKTVALK